jgi:hypothetical protein
MNADEVNGIDRVERLRAAEQDEDARSERRARASLYGDRTASTPQLAALHHRPLPSSHHRGDAAMTTVEARGCPTPMPGRRERNPAGDRGRAAGALLTGQRQDGPSCDPAFAQYPRVAHGGAGSLTSHNDDGAAVLSSRAV